MSTRPPFVGPLIHLRALPALARLTYEQLTALAADAEEVVLPHGARMLEKGRLPEAFHLIVDGTVAIATETEERRLRPGDTVGFLELLAGTPATVSAVAEGDVVAIRLDGDAFRSVCERYFAITEALLAYVASRIDEQPEVCGRAIRGDPALASATAPSPLDRAGRILALHRAPALPSRAMDALAELAGHARELRVAEDDVLWSRGDPVDALLVVCDGQVRLTGFRDGGATSVGPGGLLGLIPALMGTSHSVSAVAETPCIAVRLQVEALLDVLDDHFEMAFGLLGHLASTLLEASTTDPSPARPTTE